MSVLRVPVTRADHVQGPADALVTMVEYGDYECPYCALAHPIVKHVQKYFGEQWRFAFRHFLLAQVHPNAQSAAETSEFAGAHELFWPMHDGRYAKQANLGAPLYFELTAALGLQKDELRTALEMGTYAPKVRNDFMGGVRCGVNGTPTFFIDGHRHNGSFDFEGLVSAADATVLQANASI